MSEMVLYIEEHVDRVEPEPVSFERIGLWCDKNTNICVEGFKIDARLQEGKLYDFTFERVSDGETGLSYYKVLKEIEPGSYLCSEFYNERLYVQTNRNRLGNAWVFCDVEKELGIRLQDFQVERITPNTEYLIKDWYCAEYPDDLAGLDIREGLTFSSLYLDLLNGFDIYESLGVAESDVRERIFVKLSKMLDVPYDTIYFLWLSEGCRDANWLRECCNDDLRGGYITQDEYNEMTQFLRDYPDIQYFVWNRETKEYMPLPTVFKTEVAEPIKSMCMNAAEAVHGNAQGDSEIEKPRESFDR